MIKIIPEVLFMRENCKDAADVTEMNAGILTRNVWWMNKIGNELKEEHANE